MPVERLRAVAWSSFVLAVASAGAVAGQAYRAVTAGSPRILGFAQWERPFVDGPSVTGLYLTIGGAVLVFMLPAARQFERARWGTARLLALAALTNVLLGLGYLAASYAYHNTPKHVWARPSLPTITIEQIPLWGVAIVTLLLVVTTAQSRQRRAPSTIS